MSGTPASEREVDFPAIAMANDGRYLVAGIEKPGGTSHAVVDAFRFPVERWAISWIGAPRVWRLIFRRWRSDKAGEAG